MSTPNNNKDIRLIPSDAVINPLRSNNLALTPGGYRHPSLIHRLEKGQEINWDGNEARKLDLRTDTDIELPLSPPTLQDSELVSGWITSSSFTNRIGKPYNFFSTVWTVPPAPTTQSGQTIFLFNGLMDAQYSYILQPVLQWGPSAAGGGNFWSVASWFVESNGNARYTKPVAVNEGDTLDGRMLLTRQLDGSFSYKCHFHGIENTELSINNISELVVATETLECYEIQQCSDYPNTDFTAMTNINIKVSLAENASISDGDNIPLSWEVNNLIIDCGQHTIIASNANPDGEVDLWYR
ncbi:hypothetical protein [Bacillus sp. TE8-1]|uniref:hypothetical protein n=1 Tax=Bacillus sp. TE8-1 TaxID=2217829 RepID=UPI0011F07D94|nr:hypothetical protein [Bacillus sp. TE8-1]KAA0780904.1 hypothetical protein DN404_00230 [Bacillus sp. TE8-1]